MNAQQLAAKAIFDRMAGKEVVLRSPYFRLSTRTLLLMWRRYYLTGRVGVKMWWPPMRKVVLELERRRVHDPIGLGARWGLWYQQNIAVSPPGADLRIREPINRR